MQRKYHFQTDWAITYTDNGRQKQLCESKHSWELLVPVPRTNKNTSPSLRKLHLPPMDCVSRTLVKAINYEYLHKSKRSFYPQLPSKQQTISTSMCLIWLFKIVTFSMCKKIQRASRKSDCFSTVSHRVPIRLTAKRTSKTTHHVTGGVKQGERN